MNLLCNSDPKHEFKVKQLQRLTTSGWIVQSTPPCRTSIRHKSNQQPTLPPCNADSQKMGDLLCTRSSTWPVKFVSRIEGLQRRVWMRGLCARSFDRLSRVGSRASDGGGGWVWSHRLVTDRSTTVGYTVVTLLLWWCCWNPRQSEVRRSWTSWMESVGADRSGSNLFVFVILHSVYCAVIRPLNTIIGIINIIYKLLDLSVDIRIVTGLVRCS